MAPPRSFTLAMIVGFLIIAVLPLAYMVCMPFWEGSDPGSNPAVFETRHLVLAGKSMLIGAGASLAALVLGAAVAFLICKTDMPGRQVLRYLYIVPLLIPPYMHALVWTYSSPWLQSAIGFDVYSITGVIFILALSYFPFVTLTTLAGLQSIDRNKEEAALLIGRPISMIRRVTLPICLPNMLSGAIFVFVFSIVNVGVADIMRVRVYPLEIFIQFSAFFNTWNATILSFPLVAITLILVIAQCRYMGDRSYVQISSGKDEQIRFNLGKTAGFWIVSSALLMLCSVAFPIGMLLVKAGGVATYTHVLKTSGKPFFLSFTVAVAAAVFTVLLSGGLGYLQRRVAGKLRTALILLVFIPFAVPATTMGIGLIGVWNHQPTHWIYGSMAIMIIAHMARFTPYATAVVHAGMEQVGVQLEEAAALSGANFPSIITKIVAPLAKRHLLVAGFIVFILAFGELGATLLVSPPGVETVPVKIYNLMHYGADDTVAAMCVLLVGLILLLSTAFSWMLRR